MKSSSAQKTKTGVKPIRKLLPYARPYLPAIVAALFFSAVQIAATLLAPVIVGKTIDYIIGVNNVDFGVIAANALYLAMLIAAAVIFQYLSSLCINFASSEP